MAHVAPQSQSSDFKSLAPGTYAARCTAMIQLGTQKEEYKGEPKDAFKIYLRFEFPTELEVFSTEKGEEPYMMGREFSFSMHEKASFRQFLESWRGKKFTEEEAKGFDAGKLLGAICQISVQEYTKNNGQSGVKIGAVTPLMKGVIVPPQITPTLDFSLLDTEMDHSVFDRVPEFLRKKIDVSPEYRKLTSRTDDTVQMNPVASAGWNEPIADTADLPF